MHGEPGALRVAEKLRAAVEAQITRPTPLTISVGVAQIRDDEETKELVERADKALYAAKNAGRNTTGYHNGETIRIIGVDPVSLPEEAGDVDEEMPAAVVEAVD